MAIPQDRYYDLTETVTWLNRLLYLCVFVTVAMALSTFLELRLVDSIVAGDFASEDDLNAAATANDLRQRIVAILFLIIYVAASVQALIWIYRSAHNARVRASVMEYTPASCVWWYFVPIATLWKPYGAMRSIWQEFANQAGKDADTGKGLLVPWWTLWIISNFLNQIGFRMSMRTNDADGLRAADKFDIFTMPFDIASLLVYISLVKGLTELQREAEANYRAVTVAPPLQTPET